ncbi:MAG: ABC transporter ATP-binding protein [Hyphomicrobiaceae bacterium]
MAEPVSSQSILQIEDLHAHYGKIHVLQGVNLKIPVGGAVALLGRNGVGKTTTLRSALHLMPRSRGRIYFNGQEITALKPERLAGLGIGYVPQGRGIFPLLSVMDNLTLGLKSKPDPNILDEVFTRFPRLKERVSQKGGTLSGGEQQMLAIGRCLMMSPRLLILDEPTEGIMPILVADIRRTIQSINRSGVSVLLVEQNVKTALKICHQTYIMEKGAIAFDGASADLLKQPETIHRYLGLSLDAA